MARKTPLAHWLGLLLLALVVIGLTVVSTTYVLEVPMGELTSKIGRSLGAGRYHHATMTDAHITCEKKLRSSFKKRIKVMHLDVRSSRRSPDGERYQLYFEAEVYPDSSRAGEARLLFMNCIVNASSGEIEQFQYAGDGEPTQGVDGEGTNAFGL